MPTGQLNLLKAEIEKEVQVESPKLELKLLLLSGPTATKKQWDVLDKNRKAINQLRTEYYWFTHLF